MKTSSSFKMLISKLSRNVPIKTALYVGNRENGAIQSSVSEITNNLLLVSHFDQKGQIVSTSQSTPKSDTIFGVCSNSFGVKTFYNSTLKTEAGLINPDYLKSYWKNIKTKSTHECETVTLDSLFPNHSSINWLIIDNLDALNILKGGRKLLPNLECIILRLLFDKDVPSELQSSEFAVISKFMTSIGYYAFESLKGMNPNIGHTIFLRDWKKETEILNENISTIESQLKQINSDHKELTSNLSKVKSDHKKQVIQFSKNESDYKTQINALKKIEAEHKTKIEKLSKAESDYKTQINALTQAKSEAINTFNKQEAAINTLRVEVENSKEEIEQRKAESRKILALKNNHEKKLADKSIETAAAISNMSNSLTNISQSLRMANIQLLKKENDLKDLRHKHSKLIDLPPKKGTKTEQADQEPIRIIHHFSCTGGTLISKCVAAQPNVFLLNEVDPLSTILVNTKKAEFTPTDLIGLMRQADPDIEPSLLQAIFLSGLRELKGNLTMQGLTLIGREHSHGKYLSGPEIPNRPSFKDIIATEHKSISLVTVRHPLDSFLSLQENGWDTHFSPSTLNEYSKRYLAFLDDMTGIDIVKYEDFVKAPKKTMRKICSIFNITYNDNFLETFDSFSLSGGSGRTSADISKRERRKISDEIANEMETSKSYQILVERLSY